MKNQIKFILLFLTILLVSCKNSDKSLLEILPKDLDTIANIIKYLILIYAQMGLIRLLFSLGFGIKINLNFILLVLFVFIYFSNNYGFLKLFFITFLPNIIYFIYIYFKKLYGK